MGKGSYSSLSGLGVGSPRQGRMVAFSLSLVCGDLSWGKAPNMKQLGTLSLPLFLLPSVPQVML